MSESFWPCSGCARHVKRGDAVCPFCGIERLARPVASVAQSDGENEPGRAPAARLSRAALFAAGTVGAAIAATGCSTATSVPFYGAISPPESSDSSTMTDAADASASNDSQGAPSSSADASDASDSATNPNPITNPQPAYGAPVPVYGGSPMPLYGGSPVRVDE
jgi:hypothetical protein